MGKLLSYSIVSGLIMLAMYLAYKLFMAKENQHGFNRGVLLLIYIMSFITYPLYETIYHILTKVESNAVINGVELENLTITQTAQPIWGTVLIWIFIIGMTLVALKTVVTFIKIIHVIHSGDKVKKEGYTLVITNNDVFAPFSWMRYVVISSRDLDNNASSITTHELKHVFSYHWVDLLIAQFVCIINWFNPVAWLMRDELMLVHEYQADMAVIDNGHNPQEYQMLLIKKAVGSRFQSLANSINHSKLKKRITMMYKEKSCAERRFKALALVPMVALALGVTSVPSVRAAVSTIGSSDVSVSKDSEKEPEDQKFKVIYFDNDGAITTIVVKGESLGNNLTVSGGSLTNKGNTYPAKSLKCEMVNGTAIIIVDFPFSSDYENPSVILNINGENVKFDVDLMLVGADKNESSSLQTTNMAIYLDGQKISKREMQNFPADKIASIIVDKQNNIVKIQSEQFSAQTKAMEIYLDGTKISDGEMKSLNPDNIASIIINKANNKMEITSK